MIKQNYLNLIGLYLIFVIPFLISYCIENIFIGYTILILYVFLDCMTLNMYKNYDDSDFYRIRWIPFSGIIYKFYKTMKGTSLNAKRLS
jgi:hypothetical protein